MASDRAWIAYRSAVDSPRRLTEWDRMASTLRATGAVTVVSPMGSSVVEVECSDTPETISKISSVAARFGLTELARCGILHLSNAAG